jgi:glycine cleavage system H lipoate-binding protein
MPCPFLREGRARYCHVADFRKLILDSPGASDGGRCTSPAYRECSLVKEVDGAPGRCPHLEEIHVQYCGASPVSKLVPFSETQLSRCAGSGHRYCDSYLALARPRKTITMPAGLLYAPNHLWLDVSEDGLCHVGVDAFLAETVKTLDGVTFVNSNGTHRPAVALTVNGVEWPMQFPNPLLIQTVNAKVRSEPARVTADPYGSGWLFEGWEVPGRTRSGLIGGRQAAAWMEEEKHRLAGWVNETQEVAGDGGYAAPGVARMLSRTDLVRLLQQFFARNSWPGEE